jgi:RNA polymerase sigma-70 factor (ECF subfamily)
VRQLILQEAPSEVAEGDASRRLAQRFESEVIPHRESLHNHALRLTRSVTHAEDLVQDTLLRAFASFHTFKPDTNARAWLHRILRNEWIDKHRRQQRRPTECHVGGIDDEHLARGAGRRVAGPCSAEDEALQKLPDSDLRDALVSIPEKLRIAVYYADVAGYTCAEIAVLTNVPRGTVMSRISRGRSRLRLVLTG